jgi:hypothetical protein
MNTLCSRAVNAAPLRLASLGTVRGGFERALAEPPGSAVAAAEIASEHRRDADSVRVTVAMTVDARDVADALAMA